MNNSDNIIKNALILFVVTIIAGVLLGFTFEMTVEPIKVQNELQKTNAFKSIFTEGEFIPYEADIEDNLAIASIYKVIEADVVEGYIFQIETKEGYGGLVKLVVGLNIDGSLKAIDVIKHAETPGLGAKIDEDLFKQQFINRLSSNLVVVKQTSSSDDEIQAISGATISSKAVVGGVNVALDFYNEFIKEGE